MKKLLTILLGLMVMQTSTVAFADDKLDESTIFSQKTYYVNSIDPNTTTNSQARSYPGLRGANQMIVYTPTYGLRTNTNEFGTEAIVENNTVVAISGADSLIPANGFVISGHGRAKSWMNENLIVGAKVYVNKTDKTLTVYITSDSFLYSAQAKVNEAKNIVNYYKEKSFNYNYKKPCSYIYKAENYLKKAKRNHKDVQKYATLASEAANAALEYSIPYEKNELKGVWIRPIETSPEAIKQTLDRMKNAGINNVFLETYFHGKTIFPSETMENYQFTIQNESFLGFDPLKIWIEEAHNRGIKINIWFESFYVGNKNPKDYPQSIIAVKPAWANVTKKNFDSLTPVPSISEHGGYFLDPANPEVQQFLVELLEEIITKYKPDGINLDYIRYPQSIAPKLAGYDLSNWGYTEYARTEFTLTHNIDPLELTNKDQMWILWDKYRQDKITTFVQRVNKLTNKYNVKLTAVIFPDRKKALETKQQDWRTWSQLGYIDGFTPLLLTCDAKTSAVMLRDVYNNKTLRTSLYAGLFTTFMGGSNEDLLRQIHTSRLMKAKGVIIFDYAHLTDSYIDTLMKSVFNEDSLYPQNKQPKQPSTCVKKKRFFKKTR